MGKRNKESLKDRAVIDLIQQLAEGRIIKFYVYLYYCYWKIGFKV